MLVRCFFFHFRTYDTSISQISYALSRSRRYLREVKSYVKWARVTPCNVRTSVRSLFSVPWPWPWCGHTLLDDYQTRYGRSESPNIGIPSFLLYWLWANHSFVLMPSIYNNMRARRISRSRALLNIFKCACEDGWAITKQTHRAALFSNKTTMFNASWTFCEARKTDI